eukprot:3941236-Rhodomonas_salina.1
MSSGDLGHFVDPNPKPTECFSTHFADPNPKRLTLDPKRCSACGFWDLHSQRACFCFCGSKRRSP